MEKEKEKLLIRLDRNNNRIQELITEIHQREREIRKLHANSRGIGIELLNHC